MMLKRGLRSLAFWLPALIGQVMSLSLIALLLFQHIPLSALVQKPPCCKPHVCHCAEDACACPACAQHERRHASSDRESDGPSLRPCGTSDAMPFVTFTVQKSLVEVAASFLVSLPADRFSSAPDPPSSRLVAANIFRPPKGQG